MERQLRLISYATPLLIVIASACQQSTTSDVAVPQGSKTQAVAKTATDFSAVNLKDTTEDRAYAAPARIWRRMQALASLANPRRSR